ncbi:MAG: hypothetical protein KL840_06645 [Aquamicrobium sp.]|nr:hypothetical protein [Aquamicrobium sp.]
MTMARDNAVRTVCGRAMDAAFATDTCLLARIDQIVVADTARSLAAMNCAAGPVSSVSSDRSGDRMQAKRYEHGLR